MVDASKGDVRMGEIEDSVPGNPDYDDALSEGESRLLPTLTILVLIVLPFLLPQHLSTWASWVLGGAGVILLLALALADPGKIDRRSNLIRWLSIALLMMLVASALVATGTLVADLIDGNTEFSTAGPLLLAGLLVWLDANLTFALLYWQMDGGGSAERLHNFGASPDFAFVEQINPELAKPGWRPTMADYLYLGHTNSLAFSPTDVMPVTGRAKLAMGVHSVISLVILSLVIANAVNLMG